MRLEFADSKMGGVKKIGDLGVKLRVSLGECRGTRGYKVYDFIEFFTPRFPFIPP